MSIFCSKFCGMHCRHRRAPWLPALRKARATFLYPPEEVRLLWLDCNKKIYKTGNLPVLLIRMAILNLTYKNAFCILYQITRVQIGQHGSTDAVF